MRTVRDDPDEPHLGRKPEEPEDIWPEPKVKPKRQRPREPKPRDHRTAGMTEDEILRAQVPGRFLPLQAAPERDIKAEPKPIPGGDLIQHGLTLRTKETLAARAQQVFDQWNRVSDCTISDIILLLAKYGGNLQVQGLGQFEVVEIKGRWKEVNGRRKARKYVPGRRYVRFEMDWRLRDLINEDYFSGGDTPRPNSSIFIERMNLIV